MEQIDSRPAGDEATSYAPQKMYQPVLAWVIFGVVTIAAAIYVLVQGKVVEDAITTTGRNAQSAASTRKPIPSSNRISSFEECVAAGYPVAESFPEQCFTPDGDSFVREVSVEFEP